MEIAANILNRMGFPGLKRRAAELKAREQQFIVLEDSTRALLQTVRQAQTLNTEIEIRLQSLLSDIQQTKTSIK